MPGPELAAVVAGVAGPGWRCPGAGPDELTGVLRRVAAVESWASAAKLAVIREMIRRDGLPAGLPRHGDLPGAWSESLNHELALALACSVPSAQKTALAAWELGARLPGIAALLADGTLTYGKTALIAETFQLLGDADAAKAEALILPRLAGKTYGQVANLASRAAAQVDPGLAERRRKGAVKHFSRVQVFREQSGAAALCGRELPPDEVLAADASVTARALEYRDCGAFPGARMDQLRSAAYLDLITGRAAEARIALGYLATDPPDPDADADAGLGNATFPASCGSDSGHPGSNPDGSNPDNGDPGDGGPGGTEPPDGNGPGYGGPGSDGAPGDGPGDDGPGSAAPPGNGPRDGDSGEPGDSGCGTRPGDGDGPGCAGPASGGDPDDDDPPGGTVPPRGNGPVRAGPGGGSSGDHGGRGGAEPADSGARESEPPSGKAPGGHGPGDSEPGGRDAARPVLTDLVIPLATLLGLAERPGEAHRLGVLDPDLCRDLAALAAASPRTQTCITVTDPSGIAIGHGCGRLGKLNGLSRGQLPTGAPPPAGLPARVNLTITADRLTAMPPAPGPPGLSRPSGDPGQQTATGWTLTRHGAGRPAGPGRTRPRAARSSPGDPPWCGPWVLTLPGGPELAMRIEPVPVHFCDHRHESHGYQPNDTLRHLVQVRDYTCTFPSCNRHARDSDFEHARPYDKGGLTCACNAGARSRKCHRVKQSPGWNLTQPKPGWHLWTTPGGRTYTQAPYRYPV